MPVNHETFIMIHAEQIPVNHKSSLPVAWAVSFGATRSPLVHRVLPSRTRCIALFRTRAYEDSVATGGTVCIVAKRVAKLRLTALI